MRPTIGVLALQGDVPEHVRALESAGARAVRVRRVSELDEVDGLVLPGGESTTMSRLLDVFGMRVPLLARLHEGMPAYGSCAGMILLADRVVDGTSDQRSLGGIDMTVRRNAFGRQVDSFETSLDVRGVEGGPVPATFIRAPWVEEVGPGVEVLASVGAGPATGRIVAVAQGPLMATSFHPEITGDVRVHAMFARLVSKER